MANYKSYGVYSDGVKHAAISGVFEYTLSLLSEHISDVTLMKDETYVISDYGTADGGGSMKLMVEIIEKIKTKYGAHQEVQVIYNDQQTNDFNVLFSVLNGQNPSISNLRYIKEYHDVYVTASCTNFYHQILPKNTINLAISFTAVHILRKRPCNIDDSIHYTLTNCFESRKAFAEQAAADWESMLLQRAKELKQGGFFLIGSLSMDTSNPQPKCSERMKYTKYWKMNYLWKNMMKEGIITEEEFINTTFETYYRDIEEFIAPFKDSNSAVTQSGLKLMKIERRPLYCTIHDRWVASKEHPDSVISTKEFAEQLVTYRRVWSNNFFRSALNNSRTETEKDKIVDELYDRYRADIEELPLDHIIDVLYVYILIQKQQAIN